MWCFNWRVYAGLGAVALVVAAFQPALALPALAVAVMLACPVSMWLMMRSGQGAQCGTPTRERDAEVARLRSEIDTLKRDLADRSDSSA